MNRFITPLRRAASVALFLCLPVVGTHAAEAWSNAASAGTIDEASTALLSLTGTSVQFKTGKTGVATVRYAVNDVFPDSANPSPKWIGMRLRDNGADARVTAQLFQQSYSTGTVTALGPLVDSDILTPSSNYQFTWRFDCGLALDFFANSYWVEVTLTRGTTAGTPGVQQVRMDNFTCSALAPDDGGALRQ